MQPFIGLRGLGDGADKVVDKLVDPKSLMGAGKQGYDNRKRYTMVIVIAHNSQSPKRRGQWAGKGRKPESTHVGYIPIDIVA